MAGVPFNVPIATAAEWLQAWELPDDFEVVLLADQPLDPVGDPASTQETLQHDGRRRHDHVSAVFIAHSLEHYLEQIHAARRAERLKPQRWRASRN